MLALPHPLQSTALARPEHPVLVTDEGVWTGAQLRDAAAQQATAWQRQGLHAGMTVALLGPPSAAWVIAWHGLGWLGAAVVPLPHRAPLAELQRALAASVPEGLVITDGAPYGTELARQGMRCIRGGSERLDHLPLHPERFWPLDEVRLKMLTSGTTGAARVVPLTTAQLVLNAFGSSIRLGHHPSDRWLACLPLAHVGGLCVLLRAAWYGTTVVLHPRFEIQRVAKALDSGLLSGVSLVPSMLERVLDARSEHPFPATLRVILLGGAPVSDALLERCRALSAPVAVSWGMTETASQVATTFPGAFGGSGACGPPLAFARVTACHGLLKVQGPGMAAPWVTSDRGSVDARGWVHVEGRSDDMWILGGENISPDEIEAVLMAHPGIADAAVVPWQSAAEDPRPLGVLVGYPHQARPSDSVLDAWCRGHLASFKVPHAYQWWPSLPRTALGKLQRQQIQATLTHAGRGRQQTQP